MAVPFPHAVNALNSGPLSRCAAAVVVIVPLASRWCACAQETVVTFPSSAISSYTKTEPFKLSGSTLTYGPYKDIDAYTQAPFSLHFTSFAPFVTFTEVGKEIEVSHWGNIAVEEQYDLQHTGAVLKGGFSRIDYQV